MSVDALLSRLEKVRAAGGAGSSWIACCPAHDDKHPSMTVRELEDGRILLHCFAGCDVGQIIGAVGLEFDALFPPKPLGKHSFRERVPFDAAAVFDAVMRETMIVAVAAGNIGQGVPLTDADRERLLIAAERIFEARRLARGDY